jgi:hypothetical protein
VTATSGLPSDEQGLATSLLTMTQQTAITVGIPIIGTIATAAGHAEGLVGDIRVAFALDAGLTVLVAVAAGLALLPRRALRPVADSSY